MKDKSKTSLNQELVSVLNSVEKFSYKRQNLKNEELLTNNITKIKTSYVTSHYIIDIYCHKNQFGERHTSYKLKRNNPQFKSICILFNSIVELTKKIIDGQIKK